MRQPESLSADLDNLQALRQDIPMITLTGLLATEIDLDYIWHDNYHERILWFLMVIKDNITVHDGDCVKVACTCLLCLVIGYYNDAKKFLKNWQEIVGSNLEELIGMLILEPEKAEESTEDFERIQRWLTKRNQILREKATSLGEKLIEFVEMKNRELTRDQLFNVWVKEGNLLSLLE